MSSIQSLLTEQISNQNCVFVFPTDIACQKWADWVIRNTEVKAVAMERFLAWDKFKGECIRSEITELKTVPSIMRKIFAHCLIQKNAENPFFKSLIIKEYASEASSFADWISSILPSLKMWKNIREKQEKIQKISLSSDEDDSQFVKFYEEYKNSGFTDDEDEDFEILYSEYEKFLAENKLFDPAWVEPDFSGDGREYFLIYPETLEDWEQYRFKLSQEEKIHFVSVPENEGEYVSYFFENSSLELKNTALVLRRFHDEEKIEWSDMAVSVPNLDNFGSYIDREFSLFEIPHTLRYSRPLSSYGAASLFAQIQECVESRFSYESLKNLLLNEDLPWLNKAVIENLLLFGRMNNCICTAGDQESEHGKIVTVWDEAFKEPKDDRGNGINQDELIKNLYKNLVKYLVPLVNAQTFEEVRKKYEEFRETFFDMAEFQKMELSNNVLSRCISSLNEIVELEKAYPSYKVSSPFSFFVNHLSRVQYLSQGEVRAVQVYPYRTAAAAPYKVQIVLDSTQDSLSVAESFKMLDFMNENKRRLFIKIGEIDKSSGFADTDPTFDFVKMYQHSAAKHAYFSASRHAYNGEYGFAYGKMEKTVQFDSKIELPKLRFNRQEKGFTLWKCRLENEKEDSGFFEKSEEFTKMIQNRLHLLKENPEGKIKKNPLLLNKIEISQTALKNYFQCPRRWLFKNVFKLESLDNEAQLIDEYISGTLNHRIFELFFKTLSEEKEMLAPSDTDSEKLGEKFKEILVKSINTAVSDENLESAFKEVYGENFSKNKASRTTVRVISSQYKIDKKNPAETNPNFRLLEKSLAHLCALFRGCKVHAVEKEVQALPENSEEGYYFSGTVDCILSLPNERAFIIIDFKTTAVPTNIFVKEAEEGKPKKIIDFQLPMYIYLLENNIEEKERLNVETAAFYSIRECKESCLLGNAPNALKPDEKTTRENAELVIEEFKSYAKRFYEEITDEKFAVTRENQGRAVCTAKGEYNNCIDYHALCRRYFTVSGEKIK
ncbi:PD-(D/E)XK nuclease family protein [Treponema sp.]|uniref:PD-(D/E)XK nuclease family protein n=1 Tax=Treponema sp. TaxID=166 RepID=UPI00388E79A4